MWNVGHILSARWRSGLKVRELRLFIIITHPSTGTFGPIHPVDSAWTNKYSSLTVSNRTIYPSWSQHETALPLSVYVWQSFCKFSSFDMQKFAQKINARQLTRTFRSWHVLRLVKKNKHISIDTLEIDVTRITRQLEYYKLQLKYPENITHNNRRTSYTHLPPPPPQTFWSVRIG